MRPRVFKITDKAGNMYYFRSRKDACVKMNELCGGKIITSYQFDNYVYHNTKCTIPTQLQDISNHDMYEFMKNDSDRVYGDKYLHSCKKTKQTHQYKLFDKLYNNYKNN